MLIGITQFDNDSTRYFAGCLVLASALGCTIVGCGGRVVDEGVTFVQPNGGAIGQGGASTSTASAAGGLEHTGSGGTTEFGSTEPAGGSGSAASLQCPGDRWVAVTRPACGDGIAEGFEQCDDGNVLGDDGCDTRCRLEPTWDCPVEGQPCTRCGNCQLDDGEACDDGNRRSGDGCSSTCHVEPEYVCGQPDQACMPVGHCGDGWVGVLREICDDGNAVGGDGCSADCTTAEPGYVCHAAGLSCTQVSNQFPLCGDGVIQVSAGEECDNGADNGHQSDCTIECQRPHCGDGQIQPELGEMCDDGVLEGRWGGCNVSCALFSGSSDCTLRGAWCGDGIVQELWEACDHGASNGKDGLCTTECSLSRPGYCGDSIRDESYEECDDGNWINCDGCTASCQIERTVG